MIADEEEADALVQAHAAGSENTYRGTPVEIRAHANRERAALDGYRGRQILELLQNADDAQRGASGPNRFLLRTDGRYLHVANTGATFSEGGLQSLVVSDASPKQLERRLFIGEKGLGLRALLAWADRFVLSSGHLRVAFDQDHAHARVTALANSHAGVAREVSSWGGERFAAILRFPFIPGMRDEAFERALRLREEGYDTALVLPLLPGAEEEVRDQVGAIGADALLFTRHLREVRVEMDERRSWTIIRPRGGEHVPVTTICERVGDGEPQTTDWQVTRESGALSDDCSRPYEVAVAVPMAPDDSVGGSLCVFFPTSVAVPVEAVLHATLDLDDARKHLSKTHANVEILRALARLLADVAAREAKTDPLAALHLVDGAIDADTELKALGFVEALHSALCERPVVPRTDGTLALPSHTVRPPHDVWYEVAELVPTAFPDLVSADALAKYPSLIARLDIPELTPPQAAKRLADAATDASLDLAGRLLGTLARARYYVEPRPRGLLIGSDGQPVEPEHVPFFPPAGALSLPAWSRAVFLHADFLASLQEASGTTTVRDLRHALTAVGYAVREYIFVDVTRALVRAYDAGVKSDVLDPVQASKELLASLYPLSRTDSTLPADIRVSVPTAAGSVGFAANLYLGAPYSSSSVLNYLLDSLGPAHIAAAPTEIGLPEGTPTDDAKRFLLSLGVAEDLRTKPIDEHRPLARELADRAIDEASYPLRAEEENEEMADAAAARSRLHGRAVDGARLPDHFPFLLESAAPEAIIAYLHLAPHRPLDSPPKYPGRLWAKYGNQRVRRPYDGVSVPDPARHLAERTAWVPGTDGSLHRPCDLVLGELAALLGGHLPAPVLELEHPAIKEVGPEAVHYVLSRLGTPTSTEHLRPEQVYGMLSRLPSVRPDGQGVRELYGVLLSGEPPAVNGASRDGFIRDGMLFGRLGKHRAYYPSGKVRFLAGTPPPTPVLRRVPLLDVGSRFPPRKVEALFGVPSLKREDWTVEDVAATPVEAEFAAPLINRFQNALPALYVLRRHESKSADRSDARTLNALDLVPCLSVEFSLTVLGGDTERVVLSHPYEGIVHDAKAYIVCPADGADPASPVVARALAALVADALGTPGASDRFASLLAARSLEEQNEVLVQLGVLNPTEELAEAAAVLADKGQSGGVDPVPPASTFAVGGGGDIDPLPPSKPEAKPLPPPATPRPRPPASVPPTSPEPNPPPPSPRPRRPSGPRPLVVGPAAPEPVPDPTPPQSPVQRRQEADSLYAAFDLECEQGRFPLRVDHIRGKNGPGCDLLSFKDETTRDCAREEQRYWPHEVARFIEVKTTNTTLTINEADAAREHGERYFLYRVLPQGAGYRILVVSNPLGRTPSVAHPSGWDVDVAAALGTETFEVKSSPRSTHEGQSDQPLVGEP